MVGAGLRTIADRPFFLQQADLLYHSYGTTRVRQNNSARVQ